MKLIRRKLTAGVLLGFTLIVAAGAQETNAPSPAALFRAALTRWAAIVQPPPGATPETFTARLQVSEGVGLPRNYAGQALDLAYQAPDRLRVATRLGSKSFAAGRHGQELWIHAPDKQFGVVGRPGVPRFTTAPEKLDRTELKPFKLPLPLEQLALLPLLTDVKSLPAATVDGVSCEGLEITPKPEASAVFKLPSGQFTVWLRPSDLLPLRLGYRDGDRVQVQVDVHAPRLSAPAPEASWQIPSRPGDRVETTAVSHLSRFASVAMALLHEKIPTLGPATGQREVVATEGKGRLERIDGTRVLVVQGSPEEMGTQHGRLLRKEIRRVVDRILYGVGVGSSFEKGRWFFGEIAEAQARTAPFIDPRHLREMDAIAQASGCEPEEIRLANFFPELFHCSGFAVFGDATADGQLYHGRVLDYLRGVGLEQNAVVIVMKPDYGNAWVNISYAGFVGSVTAMNEQRVAIGEMGGRGEGHWDGKPMAQLVRECMEQSKTLDDAIALMRRGPRTCEYYYVVSDAKTKRAVGVAATPETFELVQPGQSHPRLPHAIPDAVLMSAGDRYETLSQRVRAQHGKLDAASARELMTRPVAMKSNIHSVLFAPGSLDFWVANADSDNVASHTRYTRYNLAELLKP